MEVFGDTLEEHSAAVGTGIHSFRDPTRQEEFRLTGSGSTSSICSPTPPTGAAAGGLLPRRAAHPHSRTGPNYAMRLIIGLFDRPERARPGVPGALPQLIGA